MLDLEGETFEQSPELGKQVVYRYPYYRPLDCSMSKTTITRFDVKFLAKY